MSASDVHELAIIIGEHHRLDPMTSRDRCTCGHKTPLGHLFSEHIAAEAIRQGWRSHDRLASC